MPVRAYAHGSPASAWTQKGTVHHLTSPTSLHIRAIKLWPTGQPWDPSSVQFRDSEAAVLDPGNPRAVSTRSIKWIANLHRHEQFWRGHGRSPRERTRDLSTLPAFERRLGEWARYQRRTEERLCAFQVIRLDVSPSFRWDPQETRWTHSWEACARHLRKTGSLPRLNSVDAAEFALARWLGRQLRLRRIGMLLPERADRLDRMVRGD